MEFLLIIGIIFFIIGNLLKKFKNEQIQQIDNNNYYNYTTKNYIMTETELKFYKYLKTRLETENINANIFPQVDLERIIQVKNNNNADRNRIKSRCIDFTIVKKENCKILCCIELDDYTHNKKDRIKRDIFINNLFKQVNIKLFRIKVSNWYNFEEITNYLKEVD